MNVDNRWYSVLDDIDAYLQQQEASLAEGHADLTLPFPLPPGLGPLPPNLGPRLTALSERTVVLGRQAAASAGHQLTRRNRSVSGWLSTAGDLRPDRTPVALAGRLPSPDHIFATDSAQLASAAVDRYPVRGDGTAAQPSHGWDAL